MPKKSLQDKLEQKREQLIARTALCLGVSEDQAVQLLATKRQQSLRVNCRKGNTEATLRELVSLGWQGTQSSFYEMGYSIDSGYEAIRDSELNTQGSIYIQNASSWLPVLALDPQPGEQILDVCAAPGGKTSHIAELSGNEALITANDNARPRLLRLKQTCERMDAHVERYTLYDARYVSKYLEPGTFDKILLDAPCSGEGMIDIDEPKSYETWSVAHIKRLQSLQKQLIRQAWTLLKPGGTLVYSTCTMAPEENEVVIDYAIRSFEGLKIEQFRPNVVNKAPTVLKWNGKFFNSKITDCLRLKPSGISEAFFVAKMTKTEVKTGYGH